MEAEGSSGRARYLTFQVGDVTYGVSLEWVHAVRDLSGEWEREEGAVDFRGEKIPLIDLGEWLGDPGGETGTRRLIVLGGERAVAAAAIDTPGRVVTGGEVVEWPPNCRALVEGVFNGVLREGEKLILLVDPEGLCRSVNRRGDESSQGGVG